MKLVTTLKSLPLTLLVAVSISLSPSLVMADNSERGSYKNHKQSESRKHQKKQHHSADRPRNIKRHDSQPRKHGYYKSGDKYHNKHQHKHRPHNKKHHKRGHGQHRDYHHVQRRSHYKPHRHNNGHDYYRHQHESKHYNHRHSGHGLADYLLSNEHDRRYYLNLSNQKFLFGLHTGNVDIIYGR